MGLCSTCGAVAQCAGQCCKCCNSLKEEETLFELMRAKLEEELRVFQSWGPSANYGPRR